MQTKRCVTCDSVYSKNRKYSSKQWGASKFCSSECKSKYRTVIGTTIKRCEVCQKEYWVPNSVVTKLHCCSRECADIRRQTTLLGENNPAWKEFTQGSLCALHRWIQRRLPKTKYCQKCGIEPPADLANISQEYKQVLSDWEWLCRRCHMVTDKRLENLNGRKYEIRKD